MPIPTSPRVVFARNVLTDVLCQLRFPPVLAISANEPAAFQDRIRSTYPLYRRDEAVEVPPEFREIFSKLRINGASDLVRHTFSTADSMRSIFLTRDFLTVEETSYTRWEAFGPEILMAATALKEIYQPAFLTRIGLRYQDIIDRQKIPGVQNTPWDQLINREFIGLLGSEPFRTAVIEQTTQLVLRLDEVPGAVVRINHGLRDSPEGHPVYYFDADFFIEMRMEVDHVSNILDAFHKASGNLFRCAITRTLYDALEPEPLT